MKHSNPPFLFTLLLGALLLTGCASTGTKPTSETAAAAPTAVEATPAPAEKPKTKKKAAPGEAEPECD